MDPEGMQKKAGRSRPASKKAPLPVNDWIEAFMRGQVYAIQTEAGKIFYAWKDEDEERETGAFTAGIADIAEDALRPWPAELKDRLLKVPERMRETVEIIGKFVHFEDDKISNVGLAKEIPVRAVRGVMAVLLQHLCGDDTEKLQLYTGLVSTFTDPGLFKTYADMHRPVAGRSVNTKRDVDEFFTNVTDGARAARNKRLQNAIIARKFTQDELDSLLAREAQMDKFIARLKKGDTQADIENEIKCTMVKLFENTFHPWWLEYLVSNLEKRSAPVATKALGIPDIVEFINKGNETKPGTIPALQLYFRTGKHSTVIATRMEVTRLVPQICEVVVDVFNARVPELATYKSIERILCETVDAMLNCPHPFSTFPGKGEIGGGYTLKPMEDVEDEQENDNLSLAIIFIMHASNAGAQEEYNALAQLYLRALQGPADLKRLISTIAGKWVEEHMFDGQDRTKIATTVVFFLALHAFNPVTKRTAGKSSLAVFYEAIGTNIEDALIKPIPEMEILGSGNEGDAIVLPDDPEAPALASARSKTPPALADDGASVPAVGSKRKAPAPAEVSAPAPGVATTDLTESEKGKLKSKLTSEVIRFINSRVASNSISIEEAVAMKPEAEKIICGRVETRLKRTEPFPKRMKDVSEMFSHTDYVPVEGLAEHIGRFNGADGYANLRLIAFTWEVAREARANLNMPEVTTFALDQFGGLVTATLDMLAREAQAKAARTKKPRVDGDGS